MESKNLNIKFIRGLLFNEIKKYYETLEKAELQRDKVDLIRGLLDIFEDQELLKNNMHSLTYDYETLIKNVDRLRVLLPYVFDISNSSIRNMCDNILKNATICDNWTKNNTIMTSYEFRNAKKELIKILNKLRDRYQEEQAVYISIRPNHSEMIINQYKIIKENLFKWHTIDSYQYEVLKRLFMEKNMSEKDILILLERIKQHNIICHKKENNEYFDSQKLYEVIDMMTSGYENIEVPEIDSQRINEIKLFIESIYVMIKNSNDKNIGQDIIKYLPRYEKNLLFQNDYSKEEYDYLMLSILKEIQDNLYVCASYVTDENVYNDKIERNEIKNEYYKYLGVYLSVRDYYDKQVELYSKIDEIDDDFDDKLPDVNKYGFPARGFENQKTFFESDLKSVPKDIYSRIIKHLTYFKKGIMPPVYLKPLSELGVGFSEIKDDQVRIVYKHVKENLYAIMGVFLKKDNNDRMMYRKLSGRNIDNMLIGNEIEEELFDLLETKKHKGGRKNS